MPSIYQPRRPRASPLWQILTAAWDSFLANYEKKHRPALGPLRPNVFTAVRNFLRCGDLASGFLRFHCMPAEDLTPAIELFRHRFLQALRDGKHISPSRLADLLSWKHSGFNIHDGGEKPVPSHDTEGRKRLAEQLLRHPFSLQKITWNPTTQTVIYRSKRHHTTKRNFEIFKAPDFIAAVIDHLPPKGKQTVRYYGLYSNKTRGQQSLILVLEYT